MSKKHNFSEVQLDLIPLSSLNWQKILYLKEVKYFSEIIILLVRINVCIWICFTCTNLSFKHLLIPIVYNRILYQTSFVHCSISHLGGLATFQLGIQIYTVCSQFSSFLVCAPKIGLKSNINVQCIFLRFINLIFIYMNAVITLNEMCK